MEKISNIFIAYNFLYSKMKEVGNNINVFGTYTEENWLITPPSSELVSSEMIIKIRVNTKNLVISEKDLYRYFKKYLKEKYDKNLISKIWFITSEWP